MKLRSDRINEEMAGSNLSIEERVRLHESSRKITEFVIKASHVDIDKAMSELDTDKLNMYDLSTWLRSTYSISGTLKEWLPLLQRVRESHKNNLRIDKILVGLDQPYEKPVFYK